MDGPDSVVVQHRNHQRHRGADPVAVQRGNRNDDAHAGVSQRDSVNGRFAEIVALILVIGALAFSLAVLYCRTMKGW